MAFPLQRTTGGKLLNTTGGGKMAGECCCDNPCDPNPALKVTMTWTGGGTKTWLGETWTSGESKLICPDSYICETGNSLSCGVGTMANNFKETWVKSPSTGQVVLSAANDILFYFSPSLASYQARRQVTVTGPSLGDGTGAWALDVAGARNLGCPGNTTATSTNNTNSNLSAYSPSAAALVPAALLGPPIANNQFGSLTTSGGVTISWERDNASDWC